MFHENLWFQLVDEAIQTQNLALSFFFFFHVFILFVSLTLYVQTGQQDAEEQPRREGSGGCG